MLSWNDEPTTTTAPPVGAGGALSSVQPASLAASMTARAATGVFGDTALPTPGLTQSPVAP